MKKGFTLIEMLAVIVVLSLVMVIAIRSISAVRESQLKKVAEEKLHTIEKAAILYAQENPTIFQGNELTKCESYDESRMPGISNYQNFEDCVVISASALATANYLNTDYENGAHILKNDYTGENMLNYNVAIFRDNNRIYSYVSTQENTSQSGYISTQQVVPQGGMYSTCSTGYKILTKVNNSDIYMCGTAHLPSDSHTTTDEQGNSTIVCSASNSKPVYGNSQHCCPAKISGVEPTYIDGFCVVPNDISPTCPSGYKISDNKNICIYDKTVKESECKVAGWQKTLANGKYYCLKTPTCSSGYTLSNDYRICTKDNATPIESTCSVGTKTYANDKYYCLTNPTCDTGDISFDLNYCE